MMGVINFSFPNTTGGGIMLLLRPPTAKKAPKEEERETGVNRGMLRKEKICS
jgi:hypothetical protein